MAAPRSLLLLCVANSARSQMAEGWARRLFGDQMRVQSAGSHPTQVSPDAIEVMREVGIDLTRHESKAVDGIAPETVEAVITLCAEEACPLFLGKARRLHWPIPNPVSGGALGHAERLGRFRAARDEIHRRLVAWGESGFA